MHASKLIQMAARNADPLFLWRQTRHVKSKTVWDLITQAVYNAVPNTTWKMENASSTMLIVSPTITVCASFVPKASSWAQMANVSKQVTLPVFHLVRMTKQNACSAVMTISWIVSFNARRKMATAKNTSMEFAQNAKITSSCTVLFASLTLLAACSTVEKIAPCARSIMFSKTVNASFGISKN